MTGMRPENTFSFSAAEMGVRAKFSNTNGIYHEIMELHGITFSTHRDQYPVTRMGSMRPLAHVGGFRTSAGEMEVENMNHSGLSALVNELSSAINVDPDYVRYDMLPPLDVLVSISNEDVAMFKYIIISQLRFIEKDEVLSMSDITSPIILRFTAEDFLSSALNTEKKEITPVVIDEELMIWMSGQTTSK